MIDRLNHLPRPVDAELDFLLRRAEQESIAAIRATDFRASERHDAMATAYSAQAAILLGIVDGDPLQAGDNR